LHKLVRKRVEVVAHGGIVYKGQLIEASEEAIFLKGDTGWITIPMEKVVAVREEGADEVKKDWRDRDVDPSFFQP